VFLCFIFLFLNVGFKFEERQRLHLFSNMFFCINIIFFLFFGSLLCSFFYFILKINIFPFFYFIFNSFFTILLFFKLTKVQNDLSRLTRWFFYTCHFWIFFCLEYTIKKTMNCSSDGRVANFFI